MPGYKIKKYNISNAAPGMIIAKDILTEDGIVVLNEDTIITEKLIEGLHTWNIEWLYVKEQDKSPKTVKKTLINLPRKVPQELSAQYDNTVATIKKFFEAMRYFNEVPLADMQELSDVAINSILDTTGIINHLHAVQRTDDYTFHHSANVSVICGVLGKWLGYRGNELKNLVFAGLLHDIGKTQIPLEILNKPGSLLPDEMNIMRSHSLFGYKMVKYNSSITSDIALGVLQHHERIDGSGYPLHLKGDKIHPYAKIIAVADIYDALTSDRVYRAKMSPFEVVDIMIQEMFNKIDVKVCTAFLNNVRDYFIGNIIKLSDGRIAEVVFLSQSLGSRPVVRTENGEFIDLAKSKDIYIVDLV